MTNKIKGLIVLICSISLIVLSMCVLCMLLSCVELPRGSFDCVFSSEDTIVFEYDPRISQGVLFAAADEYAATMNKQAIFFNDIASRYGFRIIIFELE